MKRRTRLLKATALESLTLSVEVFNRPSPVARTQGVLLNLQHAFETLLKAVIWDDRGRIQPRGGGNSYSFRECIGIVRGMGKLSEDEAVTARVRGLDRVRLHADLTILAKLACALSRARAVPVAA